MPRCDRCFADLLKLSDGRYQACGYCDLQAQLTESQARLSKAMTLINEQAEDEALWFQATTASEAYLQQSLRLLTDAVEGDSDG